MPSNILGSWAAATMMMVVAATTTTTTTGKMIFPKSRSLRSKPASYQLHWAHEKEKKIWNFIHPLFVPVTSYVFPCKCVYWKMFLSVPVLWYLKIAYIQFTLHHPDENISVCSSLFLKNYYQRIHFVKNKTLSAKFKINFKYITVSG